MRRVALLGMMVVSCSRPAVPPTRPEPMLSLAYLRPAPRTQMQMPMEKLPRAHWIPRERRRGQLPDRDCGDPMRRDDRSEPCGAGTLLVEEGDGAAESPREDVLRVVLDGVRTERRGNHVTTATDFLPLSPTRVLSVPSYLGGGFVFLSAARASYARTFTGERRELAAPGGIVGGFVATDSVVLRGPSEALYTVSPETLAGRAPVSLAAPPSIPQVAEVKSYVAKDALRAAAVISVRGLVVTTDGGRTWKSVNAPFSSQQHTGSLTLEGDGYRYDSPTDHYVFSTEGIAQRLPDSAGQQSRPRAATDAGPDPLPEPVLLASAIARGVLLEGTPSRALLLEGGELVVVDLEDGAAVARVPVELGPPDAIPPVEFGGPPDAVPPVEFGGPPDAIPPVEFGGPPDAVPPVDVPPKTEGCKGILLAKNLVTAAAATGATPKAASPPSPLQIGFVCTETSGLAAQAEAPHATTETPQAGRGTAARTAIYVLDAEVTPGHAEAAVHLRLLRRWEGARSISDSGNGLFVARGLCEGAVQRGQYCVFEGGRTFRDVQVQEASPPIEAVPAKQPFASKKASEAPPASVRLVALGEGKVAIVTPPSGTSEGRLTLADHGQATTFPLSVVGPSAARADVAKGLWLDGFQEVAPGVLGGWVENDGFYTGLRIDADGQTSASRSPTDATRGAVGGAYGFVRAPGRKQYATNDFGKTWAEVEGPSIEDRYRPSLVGCTEIGCALSGWLRVGWGRTVAPPPRKAEFRPVGRGIEPIHLACPAPSTPSSRVHLPPRKVHPQGMVASSRSGRAEVAFWGATGTGGFRQFDARWFAPFGERSYRTAVAATSLLTLSDFSGAQVEEFTTDNEREALLSLELLGVGSREPVLLHVSANGTPRVLRDLQQQLGRSSIRPSRAVSADGKLYVFDDTSGTLFVDAGGTLTPVVHLLGDPLFATSPDSPEMAFVTAGRPRKDGDPPAFWLQPFSLATREFGDAIFGWERGEFPPVCHLGEDGLLLTTPLHRSVTVFEGAGQPTFTFSSGSMRLKIRDGGVCLVALEGLEGAVAPWTKREASDAKAAKGSLPVELSTEQGLRRYTCTVL